VNSRFRMTGVGYNRFTGLLDAISTGAERDTSVLLRSKLDHRTLAPLPALRATGTGERPRGKHEHLLHEREYLTKV